MSEFFEDWFTETSNSLKDEIQQTDNTQFEDPFSKEVWESTYKDHTDEDINDTIYRVASTAASVELTSELREEWTRTFYHMLSQFRVTAGGRIYSNIGTEWKGTTLMNCFVAPRQHDDIDSLDSILNNLRNQCQTLKAEGGWGENFSYIRQEVHLFMALVLKHLEPLSIWRCLIKLLKLSPLVQEQRVQI